MTEESNTDAWTSWQKGNAAKPETLREKITLRLSEFDWAMLLVPGIVLVSAVMITVPLLILL